MQSQLKKPVLQFRIFLGFTVLTALVLFASLHILVDRKPARVKLLHREIESLQERLISAQITSQKLDRVQDLIEKNLALSSGDSLAQGASLSFLRDLTQVLDALHITLVTLEPESVIRKGSYIETPYSLEVFATYEQFTELINKMEKSPRLISIRQFELENSLERYFGENRQERNQCRGRLLISTLTWIRET